jgi:hypothetical protein
MWARNMTATRVGRYIRVVFENDRAQTEIIVTPRKLSQWAKELAEIASIAENSGKSQKRSGGYSGKQ